MSATPRRFVVCIHDATPAYERETRVMIRELAPLIGRGLSFGVVPDWHGEWPLAAHRDYCDLLRAHAGELLLHGYFHRRQRGYGPITLLTGNSDEMNGLDCEETRLIVERGQRVFTEVFGAPARGFLAPAWQVGHVRHSLCGLEHVLGFFSLEPIQPLDPIQSLGPLGQFGPCADKKIPLSTWSWDCGRWAWLGHLGHGLGWLRQSLKRRDGPGRLACGAPVPVLAIHPRDIERGFWPTILCLARELVDAGYEASTPAALLDAHPAREAREC